MTNFNDMTMNELVAKGQELADKLGTTAPNTYHTKAKAIERVTMLDNEWQNRQCDPALAVAAEAYGITATSCEDAVESSKTDERTGAERLGIRPWDGPYAQELHVYKVGQLSAAPSGHRNVWERAAFYGFGSVNDYMESQFFNNMKYRLREKGAPQDEISQVTALFKLAEDKKVTKTRGKLEVDSVGV